MNPALAVTGLGMCSALGHGAAINAAAMRCGYDGFEQTPFTEPHSIEPQLGATAYFRNPEDRIQLRGLARLATLAHTAIHEALSEAGRSWRETPLLLCLAEPERPGPAADDAAPQELLERIQASAPGFDQMHPESRLIRAGRCGFVLALQLAQRLFRQTEHRHCLIVGVDSYLNAATLGALGGGLYGEGRRLLGEDHPNGFIPGEAATAVHLSHPAERASPVHITGIGLGNEPVTLDSDEVLRGNGLAQAIEQAVAQSGIPVHQTQFRIASLSGEEYFFREAALAQIKTLKQKIPEHPLWHPADAIGETGAAVGGAMVVMGYHALVMDYAPGPNALCHLSNDAPLRGAFLLSRHARDTHD